MSEALSLFAINYAIIGMFFVWVLLGYLQRNPRANETIRQMGYVMALGWTFVLWPVALYVGCREVKRRRGR
jgi:hypothetical protein